MLRQALALMVLALVVAALGIGAPAAGAAGSCLPVSGSGTTFAIGPTTFAGTADLTVGGVTYADAPATTFVIGAPALAGGSGVEFLPTSHTVELPTGTVTTSDAARLIPTDSPGVYRLVTNATVTGGGSGHLHLQGLIDFAAPQPTATWSVRGVVCD